jgi:hypothetical protein
MDNRKDSIFFEIRMITGLRIRKLVFLFLMLSVSGCGRSSPACSTTGLMAPNLDTPADLAVADSLIPTLRWNYPDSGCHPQGYRIEVSEDKLFADLSKFAADKDTTPLGEAVKTEETDKLVPEIKSHEDALKKISETDSPLWVANLVGGKTGISSTQWSPVSNLNPGKEYFWRIAAMNDGTLGPFSAPRRFFTGPYCEPATLAAPIPYAASVHVAELNKQMRPLKTDNSHIWSSFEKETIVTRMPLLQWSNGNEGCIPERYGIHLSTDPSFVDPGLSGGNGNPDQNWHPGLELTDCTTYYWNVFAMKGTTVGPVSTTRSFRTNAGGTCPAEGTGFISGLVWHDLCALPDAPASEPPPGCIDLGGGEGLGANGVYDPGEPGIPGVLVRLGQGTCMPTIILATSITGADGSYSFQGLPAGTYCVFVDSLEEDNILVLIPGGWTHPLHDVNPTRQAVILGDGEPRSGIIFGWDYQFLPSPPTPTPTPAFTPTFTLTPPPAPFFKVAVKPNHIYYRGTNCGDMEAQFQVQVSDPAKVAGVWLFVRLKNKNGEDTTDWSGALIMTPMGSGWYSYMLLSEDIPKFTAFRDAWVQYQFVAYDKSFAEVARTDVLWDVELSACGK